MLDIKLTSRLYRQSYLSYLATYFCAIMVFWLFQDVAPDKILNTWLLVFSVITLVRVVLSLMHHTHEHKRVNEFWLIIFLVMTAISGTMWGLTGFLFLPANMEFIESILYHGILLLCIAGLVTGAIITYSVSRMVYLSFSIPAIVPQCLMLIAKGDKYHSFLGGVILAYTIIIFVISVYVHRIFADYCKVETENDFLKLTLEKHNIKIEEH